MFFREEPPVGWRFRPLPDGDGRDGEVIVPLLSTGLAKRGLDAVVALSLLLLLLPVFLLIAAAIVLDSRGPVIFRCRRMGRGGREFDMLKFRKMRDGASGPALTLAGDSRFTRIGRFLALSKLDELPQLVNVLKGEMSLVGPRPEDPRYVRLQASAYQRILSIAPGVTGLSQLAYTRESEILGTEAPHEVYVERILPQKVATDLLYVERRSFLMDVRILWWTALAVVGRRNVEVDPGTGALSLRRPPVGASGGEAPSDDALVAP